MAACPQSPPLTETVAAQLSQTLPPIKNLFGTLDDSIVKAERLETRYVKYWETFLAEVKETIASTDLTGHVSATNSPEEEVYIVGNEYGLAGRLAANVGVPLGKSFKVSANDELRKMRFADAEVEYERRRSSLAPSMIIVSETYDPKIKYSRTSCRAVGVLKSGWHDEYMRLNLVGPGPRFPEELRVNNGLEGPLGQLARHMSRRGLKYGFISTYELTFFVKRTGVSEFFVTEPLQYDCSSPTIRECFYHLGTLIAGDEAEYRFLEPEGFRIASLTTEGPEIYRIARGRAALLEPKKEESLAHLSELRAYIPPETPCKPIAVKDITTRTVIFGEYMVSQYVFEIVEIISRSRKTEKMVFRGMFQGQECIAKYFPRKLVESFEDESMCYQCLPRTKYTPKMLAYGDIVLSDDLQKGFLIVLTKEKGLPLCECRPDDLPIEEKRAIRRELLKATEVLRSIDIYHGDPGQHNVLWDRETGSLIIYDFEIMFQADDRSTESWEVRLTLGRDFGV